MRAGNPAPGVQIVERGIQIRTAGKTRGKYEGRTPGNRLNECVNDSVNSTIGVKKLVTKCYRKK